MPFMLPAGISRVVRSLRFRLTISYLMIFGLLLVGVGLFFRISLQRTFDERVRELLRQDSNAVRGFLHIEHGQANWTVDPRDLEATTFVDRLRRTLLIADSDGNVLEVSNDYRLLGVETQREIQRWFSDKGPEYVVKTDQRGDRALLRYGIYRSGGKQYLLVVGRRTSDTQPVAILFINNYFFFLPVLLLLTGAAGWFIAKRALHPLNQLADAAQKISGSSLHLRIPPRHANDELDRLIESFNMMMERLSTSFEQISRFSTDVSHELRTPLTAIRGQLEVALFTATSVDQYRDAMVNALQDVERLTNIVRALLLLSRAETGQLALNMQLVNLSDVVRDLIAEFDIPAEEAAVSLHAHLEPGLMVTADKTQMDRMVSNLLSNAVKYTPSGGHVDVYLRHLADSGEVELVFQDTGQGIPKESLPHIFERFYKVPANDPDKGLGLGLSFVAWIVKAHAGRIHVESELGKGTRFEVRLPLTGMKQDGGQNENRSQWALEESQ